MAEASIEKCQYLWGMQSTGQHGNDCRMAFSLHSVVDSVSDDYTF